MIKTIYLKYDNVIVNFNFKNKSAMQKIFPIATNYKVKARLLDKLKEVNGYSSTNKYNLQFLHWNKTKGNPNGLISGNMNFGGDDWVIARIKFSVKDATNDKEIGIIEVPYIKGHDGINKYNTIKYLEDDTEVAEIYRRYHKKLYKIFRVFKKIRFLHWDNKINNYETWSL